MPAGRPHHRAEVEPGAERRALAGEHDRPQGAVAAQLARGRDELVERLQGQRVELVRPVQPDVGDAVGDGVGDVAAARVMDRDVTGR